MSDNPPIRLKIVARTEKSLTKQTSGPYLRFAECCKQHGFELDADIEFNAIDTPELSTEIIENILSMLEKRAKQHSENSDQEKLQRDLDTIAKTEQIRKKIDRAKSQDATIPIREAFELLAKAGLLAAEVSDKVSDAIQ